MRAAVYLCKRTMQNKQRLELADYEAENLARLQKTFARKWEFVFMQAEAQAKLVASPCRLSASTVRFLCVSPAKTDGVWKISEAGQRSGACVCFLLEVPS